MKSLQILEDDIKFIITYKVLYQILKELKVKEKFDLYIGLALSYHTKIYNIVNEFMNKIEIDKELYKKNIVDIIKMSYEEIEKYVKIKFKKYEVILFYEQNR